jgi:hypothetical protein
MKMQNIIPIILLACSCTVSAQTNTTNGWRFSPTNRIASPLPASGEYMLRGFRVADGPNGYWPILAQISVEPARREEVRRKDDEITRIIARYVGELKSEDLHGQLSQKDKDILAEVNRLFPDKPVRNVRLGLEIK